MKVFKLNNKGMTAIEILVCFVLMSILVVSMYGTITTYKNKQSIESIKEKVVTYKNLLTKEIQDDLIKKGLVDAKIIEGLGGENKTKKHYVVELFFRDGSKKVLETTASYARDYGACEKTIDGKPNVRYDAEACKNDQPDSFSIGYGSAVGADDYVTYPLPDLGYGYNGNTESTICPSKGCKVLDFRINNIVVNTDDNIFSFYVGFYHPDLGTRYAIDIVSPINYR